MTLVPQSMAQTVKVYLNTNPDPHIITRKPAKRKSEPVSDDSEDDADHDVSIPIKTSRRILNMRNLFFYCQEQYILDVE